MFNYITDIKCPKCSTTLLFDADKRVKGGYEGWYYCEVCERKNKTQVISDEVMRKSGWKTIDI